MLSGSVMPQPLLHGLSPAELPEPIGDAWRKSMALRGDATFFEVFGLRPDLYRWYTERFYGEIFHGGRVERRIKELVRLRLSRTHGCKFCNQGNRADALEAGIGEEVLEQLENYETGPFSEREKAALRLADEMVLGNPEGRLCPALYAELSAQFDDGEILELGLLMGILVGMAKFLFTFDLVEKEEQCPFG